MNVEDSAFEISPEQAAVWNDDSEPDFLKLTADVEQEQKALEETEDITTTPTTPLEQSVSPDSTKVDNTESTTEQEPSTEEKEEDISKSDEAKVKEDTYKVRANGMDFDLSVEELQKLAPKALDYTKKLQEIAPWRKTISALKEQNFSETDVNLMIDVLKGDKNAIAEVLKRTGVDALDIELSDATYQPRQYGKSESIERIEEIVTQISTDPEYRITEKVIDSQWDSASRAVIAKNPDMIMGLHQDVKSGIYDKVAPIAFKMKAMGMGTPEMSDLDYYIAAGSEFFSKNQDTQIQEQQIARQTKESNTQAMANKRKAAAPSKTSSTKRDVIDYLSDNDESYDDWYKDLMAKN